MYHELTQICNRRTMWCTLLAPNWNKTMRQAHTGVESCSCLFPSTRHQSFNQSKCKEFSKKGFKSIQWRRDLQIDKMIWPINSWHPLIPPDWRQFRPIRCCRGIGGWVDLPLPRHLLMKKEPKILLKMWDHATFANTTFSSSIRISKRAYQLKA